MNLILIGLRGSGKSTVGRILSERLGWNFCDSDVIVQERSGMTIRELFESRGEAEFRKLESVVVIECVSGDQTIVATGGGAVLNPLNVAAMKRNGFVVHLTADPTELWRRISQDAASMETRPKLVAGAYSGIDELKKLMLARAGVYAQARDVEVDVEERSPDEVADAVLVLMRAHGVIKSASGRQDAQKI